MLKYNGTVDKTIQTVVGEVKVDEYGFVKDLSKDQEQVLANGYNFDFAQEQKQETKQTTKKEETKDTTKKTESKPKTTQRKTTSRKTTTKKEENK